MRFERGLVAKPDDAELLESTGRCYIHDAKYQAGIERLEKARTATTDPRRSRSSTS